MSQLDGHTPSKPPKQPPNILRTIIQRQEDQFKQSKPFSKKYGQKQPQDPLTSHRQSMGETNTTKRALSKAQKQTEQKFSTKQSFNQKLHSNIIKDQENSVQDTPGSRQSFRIKKVIDKRSPKKVRDDLVVLNQEELVIQKQILHLHKKHKQEIDYILDRYSLPKKDLQSWVNEKQEMTQSQLSLPPDEKIVRHLNNLLKDRTKTLLKLQKKIECNNYMVHLQTLIKETISQNATSEEEEDIVEELQTPANQLRIEASQSRYSQAMRDLKNKQSGLNLRRTYDIFKDTQRSRSESKMCKPQNIKQVEQVQIQQGDNRMTLNQKFKDFLLN